MLDINLSALVGIALLDIFFWDDLALLLSLVTTILASEENNKNNTNNNDYSFLTPTSYAYSKNCVAISLIYLPGD